MLKKTKAAVLRDMLDEGKLVRIVGAHDGLTAKLVERNGFEGVWASGLEISTSYAVPDANILTMTQLLERAITINDATRLPVVVDCDTGYGNSINVMHLVRKFEAAGIAAVAIEDKMFPKVNSFVPGRQELAPVAEFVGKIMAAKNAQRTDEFMVFARVEALIAGFGMEEALSRARAYAEAGADGIFIHSKSKASGEIKEFVERWDMDVPLIICPTTYPSLTMDEAKKLRKVGILIFANHGIRALVKHMNDVLGELERTGDIRAIEAQIASMNEIFDLQGMHKMKETEKKYVISGREKIIAVIPAAGDDSQTPSLKELLEDRPVTMLDINGKSILQRNVEILNRFGIQDIRVVTGYKGKSIQLDGIDVYKNPDFSKKGILHSIMSALGDKGESVKTILVYSDILFEPTILERLLNCTSDITLVIDRSYKGSPPHKEDLDLVIAEKSPTPGERVLCSPRENKILRIGKRINNKKANYEFVGLALFSSKGISVLKKHYNELINNRDTRIIHEAESIDSASFTDAIQYLIDEGVNVGSVEINKGWIEIHSFDNYKAASEFLSEY